MWDNKLKDKIDWDTYFMCMAFVVASRSIDPNTIQGSVLVSKDNRVLSTGYNGPIKGMNDQKVPLTRPEKYYHLIHSEENCLLAYNGNYQDLIQSSIYITGKPCHRCLRALIQKGIKRIVYGFVNCLCIDKQDCNSQKIMLSLNKDVTLVSYTDYKKIKKHFSKIEDYIDFKVAENAIEDYVDFKVVEKCIAEE